MLGEADLAMVVGSVGKAGAVKLACEGTSRIPARFLADM